MNNKINSTIENWQSYLRFTSNMYSYGFADIMKIYSANPSATAIATIDQWAKMGRRIMPKTTGYILSDGHIGYDISQTVGAPITKWQFTRGHIPFYYEHFNSMNITDSVMLDVNSDFALNIYDFLNTMMSKDNSLSGIINDNIREFAALSCTYIISERLNIHSDEINYDFTSVSDFTDTEIQLISNICAIYARSMLKAAQRTVSSTTKEQLEERANEVLSATALDDFEEVRKAIFDDEKTNYSDYDDEIETETNEVITAEEDKYIIPDGIEISDNNDTEEFVSDNNISIVNVEPLSTLSDTELSEERQLEILDSALILPNEKIRKDRIASLYTGNIRDDAVTSYIRRYYSGVRYNNYNDDAFITSYLGRNDCFLVSYKDDGISRPLSFDWQTVNKRIDKLIQEKRFITLQEKDDTAEEKTSLTLHKVGDFWELYDNDARAASNALGLYLTRKGKVAMCGFPDKEKENYTKRLRDAGFIITNDNVREDKKEILPDGITIKFGTDNDPEQTTESKILDELITRYRSEHNGNDMSFALANAIIQYLDEKQHTERTDSDNKVGWYKKTWFTVTATISGEQFSYDARFDIGDGKGTGGGSIIDHIEQFQTEIIRQKQYPYNTEESQNTAKNAVDILIPYLKANTELTEEEKQILWELKRDNPIKGMEPVLDPKLLTHYIPTNLPLIADNNDIFTVLRDDRFYHHNRQEIADFFETHTNAKEREQFIRKAINEEYSQLPPYNHKAMGYKTFDDGLCIWEGNYMTRSAENFYSWQDVVKLFSFMMEHGEFIDIQIIDNENTVSETIQEENGDETAQLSFFGEPETLTAKRVPKSRKKDKSETYTRSMLNVDPSIKAISDDMIYYVLRCGSSERGSLSRIVAQYQKGKSDENNAEFLRKEFGNDGRGYIYNTPDFSKTAHISSWFDEHGIKITIGDDVDANVIPSSKMPWIIAARRIKELIENGEFCSQDIIDGAAEKEIKDIADRLWYLHQDVDYDKYEYFIPKDMFKGGFPESTERIKIALLDKDTLQSYIDGLAQLVTDYEQNRDILRFHFHKPKELLYRLKDLQIERREFISNPDFAFKGNYFISEREKDALLGYGSGYSNGKFRIEKYFKEDHSLPDQIKFLKNEYGIGGASKRGGDEWHDAKGIAYARGETFGYPDCKVVMKWNEVVERISRLISEGKYITKKDIDDKIHDCKRIVQDYDPDSYDDFEKEYEKRQYHEALQFLGEQGIVVEEFNALNNEELEKAKENLRNFSDAEYGSDNVDFTDLHKVAIAYTTVETINDIFHELQVYADLIDCTLRYYIDNELYKEEKYSDLHAFNEDALSVMDFQMLYDEFNESELEEQDKARYSELKSQFIDKTTESVDDKSRTETNTERIEKSITVEEYGNARDNLKTLNELFLQFMQKEYSYMRLEAGEGYDPLCLEWLSENTFSIMHFYIQNGDMMYDPDIVIKVTDSTAKAITYENSGLGLYKEYYEGSIEQDDCNHFVNTWLNNIKAQGYKPIRIKDQNDEIILDTTYTELMSDADHNKTLTHSDDVKSINLGYWGSMESLNEIKDKALSLGATVLLNNAENTISIDTYDNHKEELESLAYELGLLTTETNDQLVGIDKLKRNGKVVYWNYFNEDGNDGNGQFIEMTITEFDINEAIKVMETAGGRTKIGYQAFINYIEDHSSQTIVDKGTEDFEDEKAEFLNGDYDLQVNAGTDRVQQIADFIDNTDHTRTLVPDNIGYAIGIDGGEAFDKTTIDEETKSYKVVAVIDRKNRIAVKWNTTDLPQRVKDAISKTALTYEIVEDDTQNAEDAALDFLGINEVDDDFIVLRDKNEDIQNEAVQLSIFGTSSFTEENAPVVPVTVGAEIEYQDRVYTVEKILQEENEIHLLDTHTGWYPITRVEPLDIFITEYNAEYAKSEVELSASADKPQNYVIKDNELGVGTPKEKYKANIEAIKLLKTIEQEDRQATADEQAILAKYVGWGGLSGAFEPENNSWSSEYAELKQLLTPEEYEAARNSTVNAHYTSPVIINKMYEALESFGFKGGKILEPSCGIGNFIGCAPEERSNNYQFTGVEIDSLSGRIAKYLYPQANIQITGFENAAVKDNYFDVVIGNVPFANYAVTDRKYNKANHLIHDYFVLKSLDLTRPGGICAIITSSGTMDKTSAKVRTEISTKAKLIGAIRLPDTAFKNNAGTSAVADILFLQKRSEPNAEYEPWLDVDRETYYGIPINQYFLDHPEMVCGTVLEVSGRYGNTLTVRENEGETLEQALDNAIHNLQATISVQKITRPQPSKDNTDKETEWLAIREQYEADPNMRNHTFRLLDGNRPFIKDGSILAEVDIRELSDKDKSKLVSLIQIIDQYKATMYAQKNRNNDEFINEQNKLNELYDNFYKKYGNIQTVLNAKGKAAKVAKIINTSDDSFNLSALEKVDPEDNTKLIKADIFNKRTVSRAIEILHCDNTIDAYSASLNTKARIDLEYISSLVDKSIEECIEELNGIYIFRNPERAIESDITSGWETADEYLSGNVVRKLRIAEGYATTSPEYSVNVDMLKKVQPEKIPAARISAQLGSSWIPPKYIEQFIREKLDVNTTVEHDLHSSLWRVNNTNFGDWKELCISVYGTKDFNALKIVDASLNLRNAKVGHIEEGPDGKKHYVVDQIKTQEAMNKQDTVKEMFENWIFEDPFRAEELENIFNARFNVYKMRTFDGSHLKFDGMNTDIELKPYQKDAVARMLYGGSTILSHEVGAGKTFEMTAAAMEMRRTGLANKPLILVPNHLVNQWAADFKKLYPEANVLAINGGDKVNRQRMTSRIATGDWDAVIMPYSVFAKVQLSPNRRALYYNNEIDECMAIEEEQRGTLSAKAAVTRRKKLQNTLEKLDYVMDRDKNIYFEETGIDYIFVDEAHNFKNLYTITKLSNVKGISTTGSKMAENLLLVSNYLREINGEQRGTVLASGTIIANSMTELYTAMRYTAPGYLREKGYTSFDSWIADYGKLTTDLEIDPTGTTFRPKTQFKQYKNLTLLQTDFHTVADVKMKEDLDLETPKVDCGLVTVEPTEFQKEFIAECGRRADAVHNKRVSRDEDNMLLISTDGSKCALDQRLIDPSFPDDPNSKVNLCVNKVTEIYTDTSENKLTQVIFLDTSTPKADGSFNLYSDIKSKLIKNGIPEEEIAFVHDAKTADEKEKLFSKVRSRDIRVIIGSTEKMGAGTNIQDYLYAIHHLDIPWRPSDFDQRNGRGERQGNNCVNIGNGDIKEFKYSTKGTFDAYRWQTIENKSVMIKQILTNKLRSDEIEAFDDTSLKYAEIKALSLGDPRIKEFADLKNDIQKLKQKKTQFDTEIHDARRKSEIVYPQEIKNLNCRITELNQDKETAINNPIPEPFSIKIRGQEFTDKKEAGKTIIALKKIATQEGVAIGEYRGFKLSLVETGFTSDYGAPIVSIEMRGKTTFRSSIGVSYEGVFDKFDDILDNYISQSIDANILKLKDTEKNLEIAKNRAKDTFQYETELRDKQHRYKELSLELAVNDDSDNRLAAISAEDTEENTTKRGRH